MKIWIFNFKRNILPITFLSFTLLLIIFSNSNIVAVKKGLNLCVNNIIPSLFPFFIAVELLNHTDIPKIIGKCFQKIMKPLFNIPGIGAYALFMGIISGYPVGAKIVTDLRNNNFCTKEEGERLLTFTNNSGPLFIIGSVGIAMFKDASIGLLLLVTHLLSCISVAFVFRFWKSNKRNENFQLMSNSSKTLELNNLGEVLSKSIFSAIHSIFLISGFVVLFSVIISIFNRLHVFNLFFKILHPVFLSLNINPNFIIPFISGIIELTSGVNLVSSIASSNLGINVIITAFLLGFGGISVLLQIWSIISASDISIKPYLLGKLLQATLSSLYTFFIISNFSYFKYLLF